MSPPRADPFNQKNNQHAKSENETTSYKEQLLEVQLEKERQDILRKIELKKKQEKVLINRITYMLSHFASICFKDLTIIQIKSNLFTF